LSKRVKGWDSKIALFRVASSAFIILSTAVFIYCAITELEQHAVYALALDLFVFFVFSVVAFIIIANKSNNALVLAVAAALVLYAATGSFGFGSLSGQATRLCAGPWFLQKAECPRTFQTPTDYLSLVLDFLTATSTVSVPVLAYLFPDGHFVPRWTRWLTGIWILWGIFALILPTLNPVAWIPGYYTVLVYAFGLGTGSYAQLYRYRYVSTPEQKQQTKWVAFGFAAASIVGSLLLALIVTASFVVPFLLGSSNQILVYETVVVSVFFVSQSMVPICLGFSILRRRLWDIDVVINRTLIYSLMSVILFFVFWASDKILSNLVESLLNAFAQFSNLSQYSPQYSGLGSTLIVGRAVAPVHKRVDDFINRRFYKDKLHLQQMFSEFGHEIRDVHDLPHLLTLLIKRTCKLLKIQHGAVYLVGAGGKLKLAKSEKIPSKRLTLPEDKDTVGRLLSGAPVFRSEDKILPLILPLALASSGQKKSKWPGLVGLLALGPRASGMGYSSDDRSMLQDFADEVAPTIYFARKKKRKRTRKAA